MTTDTNVLAIVEAIKSNFHEPGINGLCEKFISRADIGMKKYGVNTDRMDLSRLDWIMHAIEEQMDSVIYLTRCSKELHPWGHRCQLVKSILETTLRNLIQLWLLHDELRIMESGYSGYDITYPG